MAAISPYSGEVRLSVAKRHAAVRTCQRDWKQSHGQSCCPSLVWWAGHGQRAGIMLSEENTWENQLPSVLTRELELWFDCLNSPRFGWWLYYSPFTGFLSSPVFPKLVFDGESIILPFLCKTNQPECVRGPLTATCKEARVNYGRTWGQSENNSGREHRKKESWKTVEKWDH